MRKILFAQQAELYTILFTLIVVYVSVFGPIVYQKSVTPPGTTFAFAGGYIPDYYQYLGWIKDGEMGNILINTRYTPKEYPKVLIHPLFPLIGFLGNIVHIGPSSMILLYARLITTGIFLLSFVFFVRHVFQSVYLRIAAFVGLLSATTFWSLIDASGKTILTEPIPWSGNFNALYKFNLPPHHFLALVGCMFSLILLSSFTQKKSSLFTAIVIGVITGFLNPSISTILLLVLIASVVVSFTPLGASLTPARKPIILYILATSPVLLYHAYIFRVLPPWSVMYERMRAYNPDTSLYEFFRANGPLLLLATIGLTHRYIRTNPTVLLIAIWGFLPFIIFPLRGSILPINTSRIFQSYQYIPLSIIGALGIQTIASFFGRKVLSPFRVSVMLLAALLLYAAVPFVLTVQSYATALQPNWFNVYIPHRLLRAFSYLDSRTEKESVVLSGEFLSGMIPAFTHNRTLIARDDIDFAYYQIRNTAFHFLDGTLNEQEAYLFLKDYSISYVLLGLDTKPFEDSPYYTSSFLSEVYKDSGITIMKVRSL